MLRSHLRYRYTLHGCCLESSFSLPGLRPKKQAVDGLADMAIDIHPGPAAYDPTQYDAWRPSETTGGPQSVHLEYLRGPDDFLVRYHPMVEFRIGKDGKTISVYVPGGDLTTIVRDILMGPILATAAVIQGIYPIHGSCVARDGRAMAFIGLNGQGKSTLATTFVEAGWELLTDGMFVTSLVTGEWAVHPGDPRIRLRADAAVHLGHAEEGEYVFKQALEVGEEKWGKFGATPTPLTCMYVLEPSMDEQPVVISPCSGQDALITAVANSYAVNTYQQEFLGPHLKFIGGLLDQVKLKRLHYTRKLDHLPEVHDALLEDFDAG